MPHTRQRHNRKFQTLADLHGHDLYGVCAGVVVACAFAHAEGQFAVMQSVCAGVHRVPVGAQDGHVAPGVALFVGGAYLVCNGNCFFTQAGQFDDDGCLVVAAAADGFDLGYAVLVLKEQAIVRLHGYRLG